MSDVIQVEPVMAIVINGGLPECLVIDEWPFNVPKPVAVCVDLDQDLVSARCRTIVDYANSPENALCHEIQVVEYGSMQGPASDVNPQIVLETVRKEMRQAGAQQKLQDLQSAVQERIKDQAARDYFTAQLAEIRSDIYGDA